MPVEQLAPLTVAQCRRLLRRADNIGEEHGRQLALGLGRVPGAGNERLDLVEDAVRVPDERHVIVTGKLDVLGARTQ
jgi:hypothetical protein